MPDREKVIQGLEFTKAMITFNPSTGEDIEPGNLNEADKTTYDACVGAIALLKEQEAVKPEMEHSGSGVTWWNVCGNCKTAINPNDKFCHECGRPILWEGR